MNEILLAILISIILTGVAYGIAEFLMKILSINHPKNTFFVYFLVFLISFSFIPLSYVALSDSINPSDDPSSLSEIEELSDMELENLPTSSISTKITPLSENDEPLFTKGTIPSRFILEISWYDFIAENQNTAEQPIESNNNQKGEQQTEKADQIPVLSSTLPSLEKLPPLFLVSIFLTLFAGVYILYHLFIGKNHYLKKINATFAQNENLLQIVKQLSKDLHIPIPKIYIYHGAPNAFVLGHPATLVISDRLPEVLSSNELKTTLRHELTHIKQHDILLKAFIQAARIICFYNPFVHLAAKKIFNKRELLADASYNTSHGDKVSFMEALIKIAEYTQSLSKTEYKATPSLSVSLLELSSYHPSMTDRFISLFKQCKKKTVLTILVSFVILFANGSAILFAHSYFSAPLTTDSSSDDLVHVEEQYLVEDVTYTTFYQNNEQFQGKMVHKTLYNVISLPTFTNNSNIREIIMYILLKYYQNQQEISAF